MNIFCICLERGWLFKRGDNSRQILQGIYFAKGGNYLRYGFYSRKYCKGDRLFNFFLPITCKCSVINFVFSYLCANLYSFKCLSNCCCWCTTGTCVKDSGLLRVYTPLTNTRYLCKDYSVRTTVR